VRKKGDRSCTKKKTLSPLGFAPAGKEKNYVGENRTGGGEKHEKMPKGNNVKRREQQFEKNKQGENAPSDESTKQSPYLPNRDQVQNKTAKSTRRHWSSRIAFISSTRGERREKLGCFRDSEKE